MPVRRFNGASGSIIPMSPWVRVQLWGGGGSGGAATTTSGNKGGGGGGGEYAAEPRLSVVAGTSYNVVAGASKTATTIAQNGNASTFNSTTVVANPGFGGTVNATAGTGGGIGGTGSTNTVHYDGGRGGNVNGTTNSGPGGGAAGWTSSSDPTPLSGGAGADNAITAGTGRWNATPAQGTAGAGRTTTGLGNAGAAGGGGGGSWRTTADRNGTTATAGYASVDWLPPSGGMLLSVGI